MPPHRHAYRPVVMGLRGAVTSAHPLASMAGIRMLLAGGNAVDAAVAVASTLNVVEPFMSSCGGIGLLVVSRGAERHVLDFIGPSPRAADLTRCTDDELAGGAKACATPGNLAGWLAAHERFGRLPRATIFEPAIELAEDGFPMYEALAAWIRHYRAKYEADPECARTLLPGGRPPRPGEMLVQRDLGRSLSLLARRGARELYDGELASAYTRYMDTASGLTTAADLKSFHAQVAEPVSGEYRGHTVLSQPPMSQGWMLLQMLQALEATGVGADDTTAAVAAQVRAVRRAFEDRERCFGDPRFVDFTLESVLPRRAHGAGDTTSLSVVDAEGNAVSMIQSLWVDAGVMVPGTGILLNARLNSCTVTPGHPDIVAGGKTPVYTMHTFMMLRDGALVALGGTPGGNSQVQTNMQVITRLVDAGMSAQEAVEAPRFVAGGALHYGAASTVSLESRFPQPVFDTLAAEGHDVASLPEWAELNVEGTSVVTVGSAKIIAVDPATGARTLGVDPRREAHGIVT